MLPPLPRPSSVSYGAQAIICLRYTITPGSNSEPDSDISPLPEDFCASTSAPGDAGSLPRADASPRTRIPLPPPGRGSCLRGGPGPEAAAAARAPGRREGRAGSGSRSSGSPQRRLGSGPKRSGDFARRARPSERGASATKREAHTCGMTPSNVSVTRQPSLTQQIKHVLLSARRQRQLHHASTVNTSTGLAVEMTRSRFRTATLKIRPATIQNQVQEQTGQPSAESCRKGLGHLWVSAERQTKTRAHSRWPPPRHSVAPIVSSLALSLRVLRGEGYPPSPDA